MHVRRIDPFSPEVLAFRTEVILVDEGSDPVYLTEDIRHHPDIPEEVFKFSKHKWDRYGFDALYGVFVGDDLAALSGVRLYGENKYLRAGMVYYVLKRYRQVVRSWLWKPGGMIEQSLKDFPGAQFCFVSIYPHNAGLEAWCQALRRQTRYGQLGGGDHMSLLRGFTLSDDPLEFHGPEQYILYMRLDPADTTPVSEMFDSLRGTR